MEAESWLVRPIPTKGSPLIFWNITWNKFLSQCIVSLHSSMSYFSLSWVPPVCLSFLFIFHIEAEQGGGGRARGRRSHALRASRSRWRSCDEVVTKSASLVDTGRGWRRMSHTQSHEMRPTKALNVGFYPVSNVLETPLTCFIPMIPSLSS